MRRPSVRFYTVEERPLAGEGHFMAAELLAGEFGRLFLKP